MRCTLSQNRFLAMIAYHQTLAILLEIDDELMLTLAKLCLLHSRSLLQQNQGNMTYCLMECVTKKQCRLACFGALSKVETFSHGYEKTTVVCFSITHVNWSRQGASAQKRRGGLSALSVRRLEPRWHMERGRTPRLGLDLSQFYAKGDRE